MATQWEYKSVALAPKGRFIPTFETGDLEELLNSLGRDGWELVTILGDEGTANMKFQLIAVFKRPR
ncbi:MAG: DUF4177 domain-containing protein [Planctomycetaceae bacterium]|nr:DUF4177 domain-containing protein [Planctomycetaceae bacterium]